MFVIHTTKKKLTYIVERKNDEINNCKFQKRKKQKKHFSYFFIPFLFFQYLLTFLFVISLHTGNEFSNDCILDDAKKKSMNVCNQYQKKKNELTPTYVAARNIDRNYNCKFRKKNLHKKNILATFFILNFFLPIPSNLPFRNQI